MGLSGHPAKAVGVQDGKWQACGKFLVCTPPPHCASAYITPLEDGFDFLFPDPQPSEVVRGNGS